MSVDRWGYEWKVEQEFGPEMAGQRVGWAAITEGNTYEGVFQANLVTTTVGEHGATIEHGISPADSGRYPRVKSDGFENTVALTFVLGADDDEEMRRFDTDVRWSTVDDSTHALETAADSSRNSADELQAKREWTDNTETLLPLLKTGLIERGQEVHYPVIYYTANVLVAHETLLDWSTGRNYLGPPVKPLPQYQLPDASMRDQTAEQLALAQEVADAYGSQVAGIQSLKGALLTPSAPKMYEKLTHDGIRAEAVAWDARKNIAVWYNFMRQRADTFAFPATDSQKNTDDYPLGKLYPGDIDKLAGFNESLKAYSDAAQTRQKHFTQIAYALGELAGAETRLTQHQ